MQGTILIELGQLKKARALIESVSTKSFKEAKETLLGQANGTIFTIPKPADDSTTNTKGKNTERKKGLYEHNHGPPSNQTETSYRAFK